MSDDRTLERTARAWLDLGPTQAPDRVVEAALLTVETTSQERDLRIPWRFPNMTIQMRVAAAAVIGVLAIGGALLLFGRNSSQIGAPSPSAAAPTASTSARSTPGQTIVDAAGFAAPFRMTWDVPIDKNVKADVVDLFPEGGGVNIFHVDLVGRDPCRSNDLLTQPLGTPREFMDWLATIPKATTGPVTTSSVAGRDALVRTLSIGALDGCIDPNSLHSGIVSQYGEGPGGYFMGAGEEERWIALDVNGKLIAIVIWPNDDPGFAATAARAIATLEFMP